MKQKQPFDPQASAPLVVGISGPSAAGKTMVADMLSDILAPFKPVVIGVDRYFIDRSHLSPEERMKLNYDIPEAIDFGTLANDIEALRLGKPAALPIYDYATHSTLTDVVKVEPSPIIIVEGILLFHPDEIKPLLDYRIYVDAERDERLRRRIARDTAERGRTRDEVIRQFNDTVEPAFNKYIAPTRLKADLVLDWNVKDIPALREIAKRIEELSFDQR